MRKTLTYSSEKTERKTEMNKRKIPFIILAAAVAVMMLFMTSCGKATAPEEVTEEISSVITVPATDAQDIGTGETVFTFTVTDADGNDSTFSVHTDKAKVGEALLDAGLIDGEDGPYGLYVKTVNGIRLDYDTDGMYWAFRIDGEYASSGVDTTDIVPGTVYSFSAEK